MKKSVIDARKKIAASATKYRFNIIFLILISTIIPGCARDEMQANADKYHFSEYIKLGSGSQAVKFELVTLPESGKDSIPGPTDYVSLVASGVVADTDETTILALSAYSGSRSILQNFARPWLTDYERSVLLSSSASNGLQIRDASSLITRRSMRAMAIQTAKNHWLFYVEYVAP